MRARALHRSDSERRVLHLDEVTAMKQLRIAPRFLTVLNAMRRNSPRLQHRCGRVDLDCARPLRDSRIDLRSVLAASIRRSKARIRREVFPLDDRAQQTPLRVRLADDRDPSILTFGGVYAMRRELRIAVTYSTLHTPVDGVIQNRRRQEMKRCLRLRLIDALAFSGATAVVERGHQ